MKNFYKSLSFFLLLFTSILSPQSVLQNIVNQVNSDSLFYYVKELSGNVSTVINGQPYTILSRNKNQPGNDMAMQYIKQKFEGYGLTAAIQSFSSTGKNIYAVKTGTEYPNKKFIICAHFDDMPSGTIAPGADDNGSGTAAVIEAARVLSQYNFPYTLVFACWDEEEQGLVGSEYYASQAATAGDSIMGVINLDMIAFDSNSDYKADVHTRDVGSSMMLYEKLVELNTALGIGLTLVTQTPGITASDHASFWEHNYGAILLIEEDNDFHTQYHTVNDNISYYNVPFFTKNSKLAIATLAYFALDLNISIAHTPIASNLYTSDITTTAVFSTGLTLAAGSSAPSLYYRTTTDTAYSPFQRVTGTPLRNSYTYSFTIPQQQAGTKVQYYIAAQDEEGNSCVTLPAGGSGVNPPGSTPPVEFFRFIVGAPIALVEDSANTVANWTATGTWGLTPTKYVSAPYSFTDSPGGNYTSNTNSTFTLNQTVNLSGIIGAALEFDAQWDTEIDFDYVQVQASTNNGSTWTPLEGFYTNEGTGSFQPNGEPLYDGAQLTWVHETIDLSIFREQQIKIRFLFVSDGSQVADGWYFDNLSIKKFNVVPVELTSFTARVQDNKVLLLWNTATELNNRGFAVERSAENGTWGSIAFVTGGGTSTTEREYRYEDAPPASGKYLYRLVQADFNGSSKIYGPIEVNFAGNLTFALRQNYPNPFNPETKIGFSIPVKDNVIIKVYDITGKEIITLLNEMKEPGSYEIAFNASGLSTGVYFYRIYSGSYTAINKMIYIKKIIL